VSLFATLAIMQSFAVSEGYRRTATSGGDAAFSGAVGAYLLDRDLQMAGYGINTGIYLGCQVSGFDESATPVQPIGFTLAPAQITPGVGSNPDSITVVSSSSGVAAGADHSDHGDGVADRQLPGQQPVRRDGGGCGHSGAVRQ